MAFPAQGGGIGSQGFDAALLRTPSAYHWPSLQEPLT
jgi:hypothetical protein